MTNTSLKQGSTLKHEVLRSTISQLVKSGHFKSGDRLPSQNEMAAKYGVSHTTVREAIASLVHERVLSRSQGKGTFVSDVAKEALTFAVVIPHLYLQSLPRYALGYDIAPLLVNYIQQELKQHDASMLLYIDNDDIEVERENLSMLLKRKVDGVMVLYIGGQSNLDLLCELQDTGTPLVLLDGVPKGLRVNCVQSDNFLGAYRATKHLIEEGFQRVIHVTGDQNFSAVQDRMNGYRSAMNEYGLTADVLVPELTKSRRIVQMEEPVYHSVKKILPNLTGSFALFTSNALGLAGAWKAVSEAQIDHSQFALACFDEPYIDCPDDVLLVKVIQSLPEICRKSVEVVMGKYGKSNELSYISIAPEIRMSYARVPAAA